MKHLLKYILISLSFAGYSQTKWSLEDCINHAKENNIEVLKQQLQNESFNEDITRAKGNYYPDAAFNASRMERRHSVADEPRIQGQLADEKVEVVKMSAEEIVKFKEISAPVYEMYKDYFTPGLVDSMLNEKSTKH